jgi:hypothetical protein
VEATLVLVSPRSGRFGEKLNGNQAQHHEHNTIMATVSAREVPWRNLHWRAMDRRKFCPFQAVAVQRRDSFLQ